MTTTFMQVLVQMNIVVVVIIVILIAEVIAQISTILLRWAVRVGEVEIHGTFVVSKTVRKVQSVCVALIK